MSTLNKENKLRLAHNRQTAPTFQSFDFSKCSSEVFFSLKILFNTENVEKKVLNALDQLKLDWFDGSKAVVGGSTYLVTYVKKLILKIYTFNFSLHWSNLFLLFNSSAAKDFFAKVRKTCLQLPLSQSKNRFRNIFLVDVVKGSFFSSTKRNKKKFYFRS